MSEVSRVRRGLALAAVAGVAVVAVWGTRAILRADGNQDSPPAAVAAPAAPTALGTVTALGRLEPKDGVIRVAGPSRFAVVIAKLFVDDGDEVQQGEPIAELDSHAQEQAGVERLRSELENAKREHGRHDELHRDGIVSASELDQWRTKVTTLQAELQRAKAELELSVVRAPITGQVLEVHARAGEKVGPDGIAELGRTDAMYAIAEVYETDITKIRLGQRAVVTSPALPKEVHGTVDRIGLKIGKKDVLDTDPAADTDARVVEVEIRLDDPKQVAGLTNLRVDVAISPAE